jgi:hypothetical protein
MNLKCRNFGVEDHFEQILEIASIGSGAQRGIEDWELSRYAGCRGLYDGLGIRDVRWALN